LSVQYTHRIKSNFYTIKRVMVIKAIVVDDNKDILQVFVELLQISKIEVVGTGKNGKEAAELYQKHRPDVVFMDADMPTYDGLYGLAKIREYDPESTIVLVTGSINVENELDNCNANAVLPKPINMDKIMSVVNKFAIQQNY